MSKTIEIDCATITLRDDGIMHVHVKIEYSLEIEQGIQIVEARNELAKGVSYPLLYTAEKLMIPSNEVRNYLATEERAKFIIADAFVIQSLPQRLMARLFKKLNNPVRPVEIFENEEDAIKWLTQFVKKEENA